MDMNAGISFLVLFVFFHMIADFVLVPDDRIGRGLNFRYTSIYLYLNASVFSLLSSTFVYFYFGLTKSIILVVLFFILHLIIDIVMLRCDTLKCFILDQIMHIIVIIAVWIWLFPPASTMFSIQSCLINPTLICIIVVLLGYVIIFRPGGIIVSKLIKPFAQTANVNAGIISGGKWIGYIERCLILTFILLHQYTAIGLLVTAKSILRYDDRDVSEYVLLGTLLSFGISVFIGIIVSLVLSFYLPGDMANILRGLYNNSGN